jgi:hypothetical protein
MQYDGDFVDVIPQYDESLMTMRKGFESGRDLVEERSLRLPGWAEDNHKNGQHPGRHLSCERLNTS